MPSLMDELDSVLDEEALREQEFNRIQQESRKSKSDHRFAENIEQARKAARYAQYAAKVGGLDDYADFFGDLNELGKEASDTTAGGGRTALSNFAGKRAANIAQKGANVKLPRNKSVKIPGGMSAGGAAALGGAVAGALSGGGVKGIAGGAYSWWATRIAFGAMLTLVGFIPAVVYLDLHFALSKMGVKFFSPLFIWQRAALAIANLVLLLALLLIPAIIGGAAYAYCQSWSGWTLSKVSWVAGSGDFCAAFDDVATGGSSGGAGATGEWKGKIEIAITGAYRALANTAENRPSAHGRGEAIDIALRNPRVGLNEPDSRIDQIVDIARRVGFVSPAGDALDEYSNPARNATAGHIHLEFNVKGDGSSYCDNGSRVPIPPNDLVNFTDIASGIEISASDPRARPCMKEAISKFLTELQKVSAETPAE